MARTRASSKNDSHRWSHPLTVAVIAAGIGVIGTIGAAIIGAFDDGPPNPPGENVTPDLVVEAMTIMPRKDGSQKITVLATSRRPRAGYSILAVARPVAEPSPASGGASRAENGASPGPPPWIPSGRARPRKGGRWLAVINAPPPPQEMTVSVVEVPSIDGKAGGGAGGGGGGGSDFSLETLEEHPEFNYDLALRFLGPRVAPRSSAPVIGRP